MVKKYLSALFAISLFCLLTACGSGSTDTSDTGSNDENIASDISAPTNVKAKLGDSGGQNEISWDQVSGATTYNIYYSTAAGVTKSEDSDPSAASIKSTGTKIENVTSPYLHEGLTDGTKYYYVVTAANADGEGTASAEVSATPMINAIGLLDPDFNSTGIFTYSVTPTTGEAAAIDSTGRIIVAATIWDAINGYDIALMRFNSDGSLDSSFGTGGVATDHGAAGGNRWDFAYDVAIDANGKILVTGRSQDAGLKYVMVLIRFNDNGSIDSSFATNGHYVETSATTGCGQKIAIDSNGRIVVGGYTSNATLDDFAIWRLDSNGALDTTFATDGLFEFNNAAGAPGGESFNAVAIDSKGRILAGGSGLNASANGDFVIMRLLEDGSLDTSFDADGIFVYDHGFGEDKILSITADQNDRVVAAGKVLEANAQWALLRLNEDGSPDSSFATSGLMVQGTANAEALISVIIDPRGNIVAAGENDDGGQSNLILVKVDKTGALVDSFGTAGVASFNNSSFAGSDDAGSDVLIDGTGKIVVSGTTADYSDRRVAVWRYE